MATMNERLEVASARYKEMEIRKAGFQEKYKNTGEKLYKELASDEQRQMNELMEAILKAKADLQEN